MEKKPRLDRIDKKILEILSQDGRISYQKLSEQVNLTARPCLERVRLLERAGIIRGYSAIIELRNLSMPLLSKHKLPWPTTDTHRRLSSKKCVKRPKCWIAGWSAVALIFWCALGAATWSITDYWPTLG